MDTSSSADTLAERVAFLKLLPLFASLHETHLSALAGAFRPRAYKKAEIIFRHGDNGHEVYLIREGKIRIFKVSSTGDETTIIILAAGALVGEYAVIDGRPRSATARTLEPCVLWELAGSRFIQALREIPDFALEMCRTLVAKAR